MSSDSTYLDQAIKLAFDNVEQGGRPFGAVIVKDGKVIATGVNRMQADCDPTAHAELLALRAAGKALLSLRLDGCEVYASGQPCPMCFAAMRMAGVEKIRFAYSNEQAASFGLSTARIAAELAKSFSEQIGISFEHSPPENDPELYLVWSNKQKAGA
ncbi:nucleoside deaminase [Brucella anthropi]|uniref:nucleoside deaminase n=1 Tax=Brucella anthropi TaxID=529 RepID=UPI00235E4107|nr:nucleoside deaminase [Brucella anthropi]